MTTYPSGQVSRYGQQLAVEAIDAHITLVSPDADHIFYISGPLAPMPGCQPGFVLTADPSGLHPAFNHLDYRGARQDGVTNADTVYDPAEIILDGEVSGRTPAETREVTRNLLASLDPKKQCTLSWFTPEYGEWVAKVRLFRAPAEGLKDARARKMPMKLSVRNDDAFWRSVPSTSTFFFSAAHADVSADFTGADNSATNGLGANWGQQYTAPGHGTIGIKDNAAYWYSAGAAAGDGRAVYITESTTDYQSISVVLGQWFTYPPSGGHVDILGRVGGGGDTYIRARITADNLSLAVVSSGSVVWSVDRPHGLFTLFHPGSLPMTLICGTSTDTPRQHRLLFNGTEMVTGTESVSHMGLLYRGWGFAMGAEAGVAAQDPPPNTLKMWYASDNAATSNSGFLPLTNRGTEDVHPVYLCYGPGTFYIGNGSGSVGAANPISFGPLNAGQIAMLDTDPRRKGVIDITPGQVATTSVLQQFLDSLAALAFAGNTGPLINMFRSFFGVLPPQGPLYSKLTGRFTRPIAGHVDGTDLVTEQIAVSIVGGNADSRIVGSITPLRRWPE